jgi:hypothetical protein
MVFWVQLQDAVISNFCLGLRRVETEVSLFSITIAAAVGKVKYHNWMGGSWQIAYSWPLAGWVHEQCGVDLF